MVPYIFSVITYPKNICTQSVVYKTLTILPATQARHGGWTGRKRKDRVVQSQS